MNLQCAQCKKPITSIEKIFQLHAMQCKTEISGENTGSAQLQARSQTGCVNALFGLYQYIRCHLPYRSSSDCGTVTTYYCTSCGPHFTDAKPYYGTIIIPQGVREDIFSRSSCSSARGYSQQAQDFTAPRPSSAPAEVNLHDTMKVPENLLNEQYGLLSTGHGESYGLSFESINLNSPGGASPHDSQILANRKENSKRFVSRFSRALFGSSSGSSFASGASPPTSQELASPLESTSPTDFNGSFLSAISVEQYNDPVELEFRSPSEYKFEGFEFETARKIFSDMNSNYDYDGALDRAKLPAFFIALCLLSKSFRAFVKSAQDNHNSYIRQLYKNTEGFINPRRAITRWLSEAKKTSEKIEELCKRDSKKSSFYLQRTPYLTMSAVEAVIAEASSKTLLARPSYTRMTLLLLFCFALLGFLGWVISTYESAENNEHPHSTNFPNHTSTPITTITPLPENPCNMQNSCVRAVFQQVVINLDWFLAKGFTVVGQIYRDCGNSDVFAYFRDDCFVANPQFGGLLQADDSITVLRNFFLEQQELM